MPTLNELAHQQYSANSGTTGSLNDVTVAYLQQVTGLSTNELNDLWYAQMVALGYSGHVQDMQFQYWGDLGYTGTWNDRYFQWLSDGGAFGPNVNIQVQTVLPTECDWWSPATDCAAAADYEAFDTGFTNPADTWLWSLEPPVAGVVITNGTLKKCTVTSTTADDVTFNLKVIATDSVSTDTANRTVAYTHEHNEITAPVWDGIPINDTDIIVDQAMAPFDASVRFTPDVDTWSLEGTWPPGITISAAGVISGTPTTVQTYTLLKIRGTNVAGFDETNEFTLDVLAAPSAPVFDAGPIPNQNWTVGAAITPLQMEDYFTGIPTPSYTLAPGSAAWPDGITMSLSGLVSGTPTTEETSTGIVVRSTNTEGFADSNAFNADVTEVSGPAFHALTFDPTTKQLTTQLNGTGVPTNTHTATIYRKQNDGFYSTFGVDKKVWDGGRYVDEDNVFADATPGGADISPQPTASFQQAAQNNTKYSNDLTNAVWVQTGVGSVTFDQVGLTGAPNTASLLTDSDAAARTRIQQSAIPITNGVNITTKIWIEKDSDTSRYPNIDVNSVTDRAQFNFSTVDGQTHYTFSAGSPIIEVVDDGTDWLILLQMASGSTVISPLIYPASAATLTGAADNTVTGSIIIKNYEVHDNATIEQVRNVGPIFSQAAAVATDALPAVFDSANSADTASAWYVEVSSDGAQDVIDGFLSVTGSNWQVSDGTTTATQPWTENTVHQVGVAYGDSLMAINVDGTWSSDVAYDGTMLQGILDLFRSATFPGKSRELQRSDEASFVAAKATIDGLMP